MTTGLYRQLTSKLTVLERAMLSHILNDISIGEIVNLTNLSAQEVRTIIGSLYNKLEDTELTRDIERIHLIFKLTKQKRRFLL